MDSVTSRLWWIVRLALLISTICSSSESSWLAWVRWTWRNGGTRGGQLGPLGAAAVRRGLPRTHWFAQARSVFATAAHRCDEIFNPPASVTLWRLPQDVEQRFDARWELWLDTASEWDPFFEQVAAIDRPELSSVLRSFGLVSEADITALSQAGSAQRTRSVLLPEPYAGTDRDLDLLALGFAQGSIGALVVPYAGLVA